ncbi:MAG: phospholipase D family protein, partial [Burkholderiales bacterium]|nr:phospholipase D family protein [Burkholderiales bacterium]
MIAFMLYGCASIPRDAAKNISSAYPHPEETPLGRTFSVDAANHPGESGFYLINQGVDGLLARLELARKAQRTLDLQYYLFRGDDSGMLLAHALLEAADRGVRVRILVDDGDTAAEDDRWKILAAHPDISIRIFDPFSYRGHSKALRALEFAFDKSRLDYRMHNKLFVADNAAALIGGRNIGDAYFQISTQSQFGDDDLFTTGPMVRGLSDTFDDFWNSALAVPVEDLMSKKPDENALARLREKLDALDAPPEAVQGAEKSVSNLVSGKTSLIWAPARLIYDSPEKRLVEEGKQPGHLIRREIYRDLHSVRHELLMVSPFFVPGKDGMAMLRSLRKRNVQIRILTNSLDSTHVLSAQSGYMHYRKPLLEAGVQLFEIKRDLGSPRGSGESFGLARYGAYGLHGKMWVFDRKKVYIGSMNFDQRSEHLNTEIGLIIDSPELAGEVVRRFEDLTRPENAYELVLRDGKMLWQTRKEGKIVDYPTEPSASEWKKFEVDLL